MCKKTQITKPITKYQSVLTSAIYSASKMHCRSDGILLADLGGGGTVSVAEVSEIFLLRVLYDDEDE